MLLRASDKQDRATAPEAWLKLVSVRIPEGRRNSELTRLTGHLLRRYVDPLLARELVFATNTARCQPPLTEAEVERTVESVAGRELRRRAAAA